GQAGVQVGVGEGGRRRHRRDHVDAVVAGHRHSGDRDDLADRVAVRGVGRDGHVIAQLGGAARGGGNGGAAADGRQGGQGGLHRGGGGPDRQRPGPGGGRGLPVEGQGEDAARGDVGAGDGDRPRVGRADAKGGVAAQGDGLVPGGVAAAQCLQG